MAILPLIIAAIVVAVIYFYFKDPGYSGKLPPGPRGLPLLGNLLSITWKPHIKFGEWAQKYGNIFSLNIAGTRFIVLSDAKLAKEAFNNSALSGKPDFPLFNLFSEGNHGILSSSGNVWQEQRRFMLRNLRDFGFGKTVMQQQVSEEVSDYVQWLKSEEGNSISLNRKFTLATINSLWFLLSGKRFSHNDPKISEFSDSVNTAFQDLLKSPLVVFFPNFARAIPKISGWNKLMELVEYNFEFVKKPIEEHKATFSPDNEPRDFIDAYLKEIAVTQDPNSSFYKKEGETSLKVVISDLFGAGSETTSSTLAWTMMYLAKFPHAQEKLFQEIDQVVGTSRQPRLDDRKNMPYTEALIQETLRKSSLGGVGIFHSAMETTTLGGYTIPKDSWVCINQYYMHHKSDVWGDPEKFRPERFLSEDGESVVKNEAFMPFSVGKRVCPGEQIARDSIFLFLTGIIQRFQIAFDPAKKEPSMEASTLLFLQPEEYFLIMKDRIA